MNLKDLLNSKAKENTYNGVVKDLRQVDNNDSVFKRWINSLFNDVPFTLSKERYVFVIKDYYTGKGCRAIVYGHQIGNKLSEGNICYLMGTTDKNGVIIGKRLYDPQLNVQVDADKVYPSSMIRIASVLCALTIAYLVYALSRIKYTTYSIMGSQTTGALSIIMLFVFAVVCLKNHNRIVKKMGWIILVLAVYALYPLIVILVIVFFIIKKVLFR